jgi:hypothetical protein
MLDPKRQLRQAYARIRRSAAEILDACPQSARAVAAILRDIDRIETAADNLEDHLIANNPRAGKPRKAEVVSHYSVEAMPSSGEPALTEHRTSGAQPFRCPKYVYDATASVLQGRMDPLKFDDIQRGVGSSIKGEVPIYQIRLALRFLSLVGLVNHRRARFLADEPSRITPLAATKFAEAKKAPIVAK